MKIVFWKKFPMSWCWPPTSLATLCQTFDANPVQLQCCHRIACVHLNRKLYSGLPPVVDRLLGISTQAVFLLTRNCSSKFRPLICPMKDRFFAHFIPQARLC